MTATVLLNGSPLAGQAVTFTPQNNPAAALTVSTNPSGQALFSYTSAAAGHDPVNISGTYTDQGQSFPLSAAPASVDWVNPVLTVTILGELFGSLRRKRVEGPLLLQDGVVTPEGGAAAYFAADEHRIVALFERVARQGWRLSDEVLETLERIAPTLGPGFRLDSAVTSYMPYQTRSKAVTLPLNKSSSPGQACARRIISRT